MQKEKEPKDIYGCLHAAKHRWCKPETRPAGRVGPCPSWGWEFGQLPFQHHPNFIAQNIIDLANKTRARANGPNLISNIKF